MRYLILPTPRGATVLEAATIDWIEESDGPMCRVHLCANDSPQVKKGDHNEFEVKLTAEVLRSAIAELKDGDVYDPWSLDMLGGEDE